MLMGEKDIRSVFTLLAIQCMIYSGEIPDPMSGSVRVNPEGARLYFGLLEVLEEKTRGHLTDTERGHLSELLENLALVLKKKTDVKKK